MRAERPFASAGPGSHTLRPDDLIHHERSPPLGSATGFLLKDGLGSVRFESQTGGTSSWRDYGPYGMPSNDNGLTVANGRGYINERSTPKRACNTCMQGITTRTWGGSCPLIPGLRPSLAWISIVTPMPEMIR